MGFWMLAGLIALLIGAVMVLSAWSRRSEAEPTAAFDLQVYRDQLREIDRDVARGVLGADEAERARTEVSRRILDADRNLQAAGAHSAHAGRKQRLTIVAGVGVVIVGAFGLYAWIGAPGYPDLPIQSRIGLIEEARANRPSQAEIEADVPVEIREDPDPRRAELVIQLRQTMERHPDEPEGLRLLAFEEARIGNYRAARHAQEHLIDVLDDAVEPQQYLDLAEMMFMAAGGYVSPEAESMLNRVLREDPLNGAARYYVGLMYAQQGRPDLGYPIWRNLLAESQADDPWLAPIREQIEIVAAMAGDDVTLAQLPQPPMPGQRGPSMQDVQAAQDMSPEDRQAMIEGMIAGLADRLANEGGPPEDWARLIGAYVVLGQTEQAQSIYEEALRVFASSDSALATIREAGAQLEPPAAEAGTSEESQ